MARPLSCSTTNWLKSRHQNVDLQIGASEAVVLASGSAYVALRLPVGAVLDVGFWRDLPFGTSPRNGRKVPKPIIQPIDSIVRFRAFVMRAAMAEMKAHC